LADFGATVVRVESATRPDPARTFGPFADGQFDLEHSMMFENYNIGKWGLALDLSRDEGRAVARDLAAWADVVVESFSPGQMARFGLDYETLRKRSPGVIMLSTSLLGQTGPHAQVTGFGSAGAALAGFQLLAGNPGEIPIGSGTAYTDSVAPRFSIFLLLAALDHRGRTGEGMLIDVGQVESAIQFLAPQIAHHGESGVNAQADGNRDPSCAPHGAFQTVKEGRWLAVAVRNDAEWQRLAVHMGRPELGLDPRFGTLAARKANEDELEAVVSAWTRDRDAADLESQLQALDIPAHIVTEPGDYVCDPHLLARGHFVRKPHPRMGETIFEGALYRLSDTPARYDRIAPTVGRDSDHVLREYLAYSSERIAALKASGALT